MAEKRTYNYEGMFLLSQAVAADLNGAVAHIRENLERYGAQILAMKKWDERRLAYEIDKQKRGMYILCYFNAPAENMGQIERGFNLSEKVMRHLVIRADHLTVDEMKAADAQKELEIEARLRAERAVAPAADEPAAAVAAVAAEEPEEV